MDSTLDNILICILAIVVVAIAITLVCRVRSLKKKISKIKSEIELQRYMKVLADVANQHVDLEQLEQMTVKAERAVEKGRHLDGFGDYVRPLLKRIIGYTKKLAEGNLAEEERIAVGKIVETDSAKLTNVIENVLLMARIDSDNLTCNMAAHSVEDIVVPVYEQFRNADREFYREVESKGKVEWSIGKGIPMEILCDDVHLTKAITEITKNAFQFIEEGNIQMGWFYKMMTNEVEIFVEDNGIGIADDANELVFEPFFKSNPSYSGVGVGLTIAQALVEKMGGKICVTSRGDFGTRVSILLQRV